MTQDELKTKIAETLERNLKILIKSQQCPACGEEPCQHEEPATILWPSEIRRLHEACAANLAQAIPEMLATVVLNETVAAAVRRVREQEREACAAKLDAMADEISEDSASRAQQLRAAAEAVRKQGA